MSPQGLQGALRILSYMEDPKALLSFSSFLDKKGNSLLNVTQILFDESPRVFVIKAEGVLDRTMAESLKGESLYVLKSQLPPLEKGSFYHADLLQLSVLKEDGTLLGKIIAVDDFGAGDLLEVLPQDSLCPSFWIPFRDPFVPQIDLEKGYVRVCDQAIMAFISHDDSTKKDSRE
jgi:16S rRNA processing protein RimM